jgi:hypothetical protein
VNSVCGINASVTNIKLKNTRWRAEVPVPNQLQMGGLYLLKVAGIGGQEVFRFLTDDMVENSDAEDSTCRVKRTVRSRSSMFEAESPEK